jgi:hypothetical protein
LPYLSTDGPLEGSHTNNKRRRTTTKKKRHTKKGRRKQKGVQQQHCRVRNFKAKTAHFRAVCEMFFCLLLLFSTNSPSWEFDETKCPEHKSYAHYLLQRVRGRRRKRRRTNRKHTSSTHRRMQRPPKKKKRGGGRGIEERVRK